jgi:selenocysteine-specific elongation factor
VIIGTAGHIDHGKSALVSALTGRAMDRLAEERRRGITIDLNFAPLQLAGLPAAGIVDVPGHEDFVRTMVAGASGIDLVLLVVDGAQGPQPQTWEHLAIVEQLRIPQGIPVITKSDLAEPEWLELVVAEVTARLADSPVRFEAPAVVSAVTGQGIPELAGRLRELIARFTREDPADGFRMPIDRSFSIAGVGTVVTGTPWSGTLGIGDSVTILPAGLTARVRSLEAYGERVDQGRPGARTAVGLVGVDRAAVRRGETLVGAEPWWQPTSALDVCIELLPEAPPVQRRARVRLHLGTAEVLGRLYPRAEIEPGGTGIARLALESPLVARGNDRFVLRSYSPVMTIGGGRVLDPLPPRRATWPEGLVSTDPGERVGALVSRRPSGIAGTELPLLLGLPESAGRLLAEARQDLSATAGRFIARSATVAMRQSALAQVAAFHQREPAERGLSLETLRRTFRAPIEVTNAVLDGLVRRGELTVADGRAAVPGFEPRLPGGGELLERAVSALEQAGLEPPTVSELERAVGGTGLLQSLRFAAQQGRVVAVENDRYFSIASLNLFRDTISELALRQPVTPTMIREKLGLSRKYLIPLLEWSDRSGITRRVGDTRVLVVGRESRSE